MARLFLRNLKREIGFMHFCGWEELQILSFLITNLSSNNLKVWSNCKSKWLPQFPKHQCLLSKKNINQKVKGDFLSLYIQNDPLLGKPLFSNQIIIFFALYLTTLYLSIGYFKTLREGIGSVKVSFFNQFFCLVKETC